MLKGGASGLACVTGHTQGPLAVATADGPEGGGSGGQQGVHQSLDLGGDAVLGEGGADGAALGGEVLRVGERDGGGDGLGVRRGGGEVAVQGLGGVVLGDRQGPDEVVEVALVALAVRLEVGDLGEDGGTVEEGDE